MGVSENIACLFLRTVIKVWNLRVQNSKSFNNTEQSLDGSVSLFSGNILGANHNYEKLSCQNAV